MDTEKLIALVQQYPCLYDSTQKDFKNVEKKAKVWEKIAMQLNEQNTDAVRAKWKNLKDGYTKYKRTMENTSRVGVRKNYYNWVWGPYLYFLSKNDAVIKSENEMVQSELMDSPSRAEGTMSSPISITVDPLDMMSAASPAGSEDQDASMHKILHYLQNEKRNDAVDHLFASYAETFKKLKPRTQAALKLKLAQDFAEAELTDLDSDDLEGFPKPKREK